VTKIFAIFNQAGGVAKTTLTHNLGYHLAQRQHRILLIDIDPQASLTIFMGLVPRELDETIYDAIVDEKPLLIHSSMYGIDLVPSNAVLSTAEMRLVNAELRDFRLKAAIEPFLDNYDFILLDCPPSLGLLSYLALVSSTHVLVPVETQFKSFEGTNELLKTVARVKTKVNRSLQIAGFVPTKYASRNSQDIRVLRGMQEQLSQVGKIFPAIPRSTALADASEDRVPLAIYDPKHAATAIFNQIAQSLESLQ